MSQTHLKREIELQESLAHHYELWAKIYAEHGDNASFQRMRAKFENAERKLIKLKAREDREKGARR
jgi:hypothetical protein